MHGGAEQCAVASIWPTADPSEIQMWLQLSLLQHVQKLAVANDRLVCVHHEDVCFTGGKAGGYFEVFLKYGQPPGWHYGQYDFRQPSNYWSTEETTDQEVKFDADTEGFQTGTLYFYCSPCSCSTFQLEPSLAYG